MPNGHFNQVCQEVRRLRLAIESALASAVGNNAGDAAEKEPLELFSSGSIQLYSIGTVILTYFMGWMFLYYYLLNFGIDIFSIDIPFYYFFVYSFAAVTFAWSTWPKAVVAAGIFVPALIIGSRLIFLEVSQRRISIGWSFLAGSLMIFAVGASFFLAHLCAARAGDTRARDVRFAPREFYEFSFKADITIPTDPFLPALSQFDIERQVILILETTNRYYVLIQPIAPNNDRDYRGSARVVEINRDDVLFARIKIPNGRYSVETGAKPGRTP